MLEALVIYYSVVAAGIGSVGAFIGYLIIDDLLLIHKSNGGK